MRLQLLLCIVVFVLASLLPADGQRPGKRCLSVTACARGGGEPRWRVGVVPCRGDPRGVSLTASNTRVSALRGEYRSRLAAAATRFAGPVCALPLGLQRRWEPRRPGSFAGVAGGGLEIGTQGRQLLQTCCRGAPAAVPSRPGQGRAGPHRSPPRPATTGALCRRPQQLPPSLRSQPGPAQEAPPARLLPPALHAASLPGAVPLSPRPR